MHMVFILNGQPVAPAASRGIIHGGGSGGGGKGSWVDVRPGEPITVTIGADGASGGASTP